MEQRKISLRDRLRDRGYIDQLTFFVLAIVGALAIVLAKLFGLGTGWIALSAILLMLVYAFVVGSTGTGRVRADQAGDNCYYLGLIYTLVSLSYAIGTFDPNDTASTIVQSFGIALATTIWGLILRVFFNLGRPDLENVEEQARLELAQASSRLKTELREVVLQMKDFSVGLQQSLQETHHAATESMETFTKASVDGLNNIVDNANGAIRREANDFAARAEKYDSSFGELLTKLDKHSESLDELTNAHNQLREAAELTWPAVATTTNSLDGLGEVAKEASTAMSQAAGRMHESIGEIESGLRMVTSETERQLDSLRKGQGEAVSTAFNTLKDATASLSMELSKISSAHHELTNDLSEQAKAALQSTRQHTRALEEELAKSREATTRVHGSLVDITGKLARHFEGNT